MKKLIIENIGPIRHISLNLKKINVIIGPQSAGKSCVLKIACFCAWLEKHIQLEQSHKTFDNHNFFRENLMEYHKLDGFFEHGRGAKFCYETESMKFEYEYDNELAPFTFEWKNNNRWKYKRSRISYIPAERNVVASIPNWMEVSMKMNNIRNFVSDWMLTRTMYGSDNKLNILGLGVKYYYDDRSKQDLIELTDGTSLAFTNGSSGIQSAVPMMVYLGFLFEEQYKSARYATLSADIENENILKHIYDTKFVRGLKKYMKDNTPYMGKIGKGKLYFKTVEDYEACQEMFEAYTQTHRSDIYLEEPEQNLFPETQVRLLYDLIGHSKKHSDGIFIATHSPYILYALNNAMLAYHVSNNVDEQVRDDISCLRYAYPPHEVSVWQIKDGALVGLNEENPTIQDAKHLIRKNFFDQMMSNIMSDFNKMINFYEQ